MASDSTEDRLPPSRASQGSPVSWFNSEFDKLVDCIEEAIQGKRDVVRLALIALFAEGHLLIEDVPGVGKTTLARAIAAAIDTDWQRIQFTPDLLPSDVTGVNIYNQQTREFTFRQGPVFANIVLGDEINRASPKTQSALLEVMQEHRVTVDGVAHRVPRPFMVIATQNPIEMDGTYPLPEAQIDRFLMRIRVGYPDADAEVDIVESRRAREPIDDIQPVTTAERVRVLIASTTEVFVSPAVTRYMVDISG